MAKINVLSVTLKVDIPVDPGSLCSVQDAAGHAEGLYDAANEIGHATMETRFNRVSAPEPESEPKEDEPEYVAAVRAALDIPDNLRRVSKPKAAE